MDRQVLPSNKQWISKPINIGEIVKDLRLEGLGLDHTAKEAVRTLYSSFTSTKPAKRGQTKKSRNAKSKSKTINSKVNSKNDNSSEKGSSEINIIRLTSEEIAEKVDEFAPVDPFFNPKLAKTLQKRKQQDKAIKKYKIAKKEHFPGKNEYILPHFHNTDGDGEIYERNSNCGNELSDSDEEYTDLLTECKIFSKRFYDDDPSLVVFTPEEEAVIGLQNLSQKNTQTSVPNSEKKKDNKLQPAAKQNSAITPSKSTPFEISTIPTSECEFGENPVKVEEKFNSFLDRVIPSRDNFKNNCNNSLINSIGSESTISMKKRKINLNYISEEKLKSMAIFIRHGDPTGFQMRPTSVKRQISNAVLNLPKSVKESEMPVLKQEQLINKNTDFLVEISVHQGVSPGEVFSEDVKIYKNPKMICKLEVLGSQTVADLKDAIDCENGAIVWKEVHRPVNFPKKKSSTSGVVLIHDTIYNDLRSPNDINYVQKINEWASFRNKKIGPFIEGNMETTKIEDLTVQLGYPYVYIHLNNCEHIIVFNKVRLLTQADKDIRTSYPRFAGGSTNLKPVYCRIDKFLAKWAVLGFNELSESPMMLCTECLKSFCYNEAGEKLGDFRVYPVAQLGQLEV